MLHRARHGVIETVRGNIVDADVDAVVNAANTKLSGGGGVDGAVHRAAGPALKRECASFPVGDDGRRCPTGEVRTTSGGLLKARFVIHAVGPFYNARYRDRAERLLREVHERALAEALRLGCASMAFPAISTGAYRFPPLDAARIAIAAVASFLDSPTSLTRVVFVLYTPAVLRAFEDALPALEPSS